MQDSSFIVNAAVRRGDLLLTVSTGGISPALSRQIRLQLEEQFGPEYGQLLEILAKTRQEAMTAISDSAKRREFLQNLAELPLLEVLQQEGTEEAKKRVKLCLSSYSG